MLPESLFGTYQRYKEDTTYFTTWLSRAAIACGSDPINFSKPTDSSTKPSIQNEAQVESKAPELKGRARKLAREAKAKEAKAQAEGAKAKAKQSLKEKKANKPTVRYAVSSKELLEQAKQVASSKKPKINISNTVFCILRRAIEARKKCNTWFEKDGGKATLSNQSHSNFTDVLEEVFAILTSASAPQAGEQSNCLKEKTTKASESTEGDNLGFSTTLKNRFDVLEIQEGSTTDDVAIPASNATNGNQKQQAPATFELEPPKDENDLFELFCFTRDLYEVRLHLSEVWKRYRERSIDLRTATFLTTGAVHYIKDLEDDMADRCSLLSKYPSRHFDALCEARRLARKSQTEFTPGAAENKGYLVFSEIEKIIASFAEDYRTQPLVKGVRCSKHIQPPFALQVPSSAWAFRPIVAVGRDGQPARVGSRQLLKKDDYKLNKLLLEYGWTYLHRSLAMDRKLHKKTRAIIPIEDIVSQGIGLVLKEDKITIWTVLACRVLLDVQEILGPDIERGHGEMLQQASKVREQLDLRDAPDGHIIPQGVWQWDSLVKWEYIERAWWTAGMFSATHPFPDFKENMRSCNLGKGNVTREFLEYEFNGRIVQDPDPLFFFKQNILHCGTMCLSLTLDTELCGIEFATLYPAIMFIAHLYNAGRQLEWIDETWSELDNVIRLQKRALFGNELPTTPRAFYSCFRLKIGAPAEAWARNKRQTVSKSNMKIPQMQPNKATESLRGYLFGTGSMRRCLYELRTQIQASDTTKEVAIDSDNIGTPVQMLTGVEKHVFEQLNDTENVKYISLSRKLIATVNEVTSKLNHEFGNPYYFDTHRPLPETAPVVWMYMTANVLQGVAEEIEGRGFGQVQLAGRAQPDSRQEHGAAQLKVALEVIRRSFSAEATKTK
ncbi:hypothetical protein MMC10_000839 [Thelotrema lepadinum]|nr:hypothetical protein [Thelotrema lepadinum]